MAACQFPPIKSVRGRLTPSKKCAMCKLGSCSIGVGNTMEAPSGATPLLRPPDNPAVPSAIMLKALARILASGAFRASARRKRLLAYLVEEGVAGRADR